MCRVGQIRIYTPYMTVCMVNSLPKIPYTPYIYGSGQPYICVWKVVPPHYTEPLAPFTAECTPLKDKTLSIAPLLALACLLALYV